MMQPGRCATLALLNMEVKEATCWGAGKTPWRVKIMGFPSCFSHGSHLLGCQQNTPRSLSAKWQKIAGGGLPLCLSRCTSKKTAHSDPGNILEDERHCVSFIPLTTFWYLSLFVGLLASGGGCHGSWGEQKTTTKKYTSFKASAKGEVITVFSNARWLVSDTRGKAFSPWKGTSDGLMSLTFPLHLCPNKCVQFEDWFHSFPIKATLTQETVSPGDLVNSVDTVI